MAMAHRLCAPSRNVVSRIRTDIGDLPSGSKHISRADIIAIERWTARLPRRQANVAIGAVYIDERIHTAVDQNLLDQAYHDAVCAVVQALFVTAKKTGLGIREARDPTGV